MVEVFDSLTTRRSYKNAWSLEKTMDYFESQAGRAFEPDILDTFLRLLGEHGEDWLEAPKRDLAEAGLLVPSPPGAKAPAEIAPKEPSPLGAAPPPGSGEADGAREPRAPGNRRNRPPRAVPRRSSRTPTGTRGAIGGLRDYPLRPARRRAPGCLRDFWAAWKRNNSGSSS